MARTTLEQVFYLLDNGDIEKADELLHEYIVERGRMIYEEVVNEEYESEEDLEEAIGGEGDDFEDFVQDIEADKEDIETDELNDGMVDDSEEEESEEESEDDLEDKVEDLESQLEELRAEFDRLISAELEEPNHDPEDFGLEGEEEGEEGEEGEEEGEGEGEGEDDENMEFEFGDDEDGELEKMEAIEEATKLQDVVSVDMSKEGKLAGTGKNSKSGATNTKAPFTKSPVKRVDGSDPVDFTKGGDEKGGKGDSAKDETPSDNIDEKPSNVSAGEQKEEGKFVGTGKNSKKCKVNAKSPLSTAPKKP